MSLTDEQKLNMFYQEAFSEAEKSCGEIKTLITKEKKEKIEAGEKQLFSMMYEYIQTETEKIRREKSLLVSKKNTELKQDYLKQTDSISEQVMSGAKKKLKSFISSPEYLVFLKKSALKIVSAYSDSIDILYFPPDEKYIDDIKNHLKENKINISLFKFIPDNSIKTGGFKFYNHNKKIQINDTLETRLTRAEEYLGEMIGEVFLSIKT